MYTFFLQAIAADAEAASEAGENGSEAAHHSDSDQGSEMDHFGDADSSEEACAPSAPSPSDHADDTTVRLGGSSDEESELTSTVSPGSEWEEWNYPHKYKVAKDGSYIKVPHVPRKVKGGGVGPTHESDESGVSSDESSESGSDEAPNPSSSVNGNTSRPTFSVPPMPESDSDFDPAPKKRPAPVEPSSSGVTSKRVKLDESPAEKEWIATDTWTKHRS